MQYKSVGLFTHNNVDKQVLYDICSVAAATHWDSIADNVKSARTVNGV